MNLSQSSRSAVGKARARWKEKHAHNQICFNLQAAIEKNTQHSLYPVHEQSSSSYWLVNFQKKKIFSRAGANIVKAPMAGWITWHLLLPSTHKSTTVAARNNSGQARKTCMVKNFLRSYNQESPKQYWNSWRETYVDVARLQEKAFICGF